MLYVNLTRVRNFKGRTVRTLAKHSYAKASRVLTDGMAGFRRLRTVVKYHDSKVLPGGWRSTKHRVFPAALANPTGSNLFGPIVRT